MAVSDSHLGLSDLLLDGGCDLRKASWIREPRDRPLSAFEVARGERQSRSRDTNLSKHKEGVSVPNGGLW